MKRVVQFYFRFQTFFALISLGAGFALSMWRSKPIDTDLALIVQAITLVFLFILLIKEMQWRSGSWEPSRKLAQWWRFHEIASHFLLGGLLRGYAIFFIKSGGTQGSIAFLILISLLMLANELPIIQNRGTLVRSILWSMSLSCFLTYLIPRLTHRLDSWIFTYSLALAAVLILIAFYFLRKKTTPEFSLKLFLFPSLATLATYLTLYHLSFIPPVPLMLSRFDVAHLVQKDGATWYVMQQPQKLERWPWAPQDFSLRAGDKAVAVFKLVAPPQFVEQLVVRWEHKTSDGWKETDRIPVFIQGGRKDGFRGTTEKSNLWPGHWRVHIETTQAKEIGRLKFDVKQDTTNEYREFKASVF
ncbi:MAG: DUF2914 domain-containing protein [Bacteriovoracaceae bacterium]|nr:DUF2914 domain-containing protein [Bacteriovoracaceae bacterium]